jgi:hypothetical protein
LVVKYQFKNVKNIKVNTMSASGTQLGLIIGFVGAGIVWILASYGVGMTAEEPESPLYKASAAFSIIGFFGTIGCALALVAI